METSKIITIPNHWTSPKYSLGQHTKQGIIVGVQYYLFENLLAPERDGSWRYAVLVSSEDEQVDYIPESQIRLLSSPELRLEMESEIDFCQRKIQNLQQHLETM
ncbi:hypothetical protein [Halotia branconii]|uniref:Uncharacterized protein n=1 Tax=Halotia branconii CENA392 TaxID=1539056 RepID=A0AAJ6NYQ5_9CYAN|nr:hypothetical protein [Halotia branconii]WGV29203.1 hypothetical protein QI031_30850 [Halotia branconii CENA392]